MRENNSKLDIQTSDLISDLEWTCLKTINIELQLQLFSFGTAADSMSHVLLWNVDGDINKEEKQNFPILIKVFSVKIEVD